MVHVLIMAGGIGSRFWPKSRVSKPKQFLSFVDNKSLIQTTIERIESLVPAERILVSTNIDYVDLVKEQIPEIPDENIIGEPVAKNTAPCIAFAAALIHERDPDATMVVLPSDHYIRDNQVFIQDLTTCINSLDDNSDRLVTLGITPNRPETGYGYIQFNDSQTIKIDDFYAYPVKTFAEKPDLQTAVKFLESGDFLWNSGMFVWKTGRILQEIEEQLPVLHHQVTVFSDALKKSNGLPSDEILNSVYQACFPVSIDYGIMEKSANVIVVPSHFDWSDLGSWLAVYEIHREDGDEDGNVMEAGNTLAINSNNCYVSSQSKKLITLVGLQGVGIIETDDALLICKLENSQEVKEVYNKLDDDTQNKYR